MIPTPTANYRYSGTIWPSGEQRVTAYINISPCYFVPAPVLLCSKRAPDNVESCDVLDCRLCGNLTLSLEAVPKIHFWAGMGGPGPERAKTYPSNLGKFKQNRQNRQFRKATVLRELAHRPTHTPFRDRLSGNSKPQGDGVPFVLLGRGNSSGPGEECWFSKEEQSERDRG